MVLRDNEHVKFLRPGDVITIIVRLLCQVSSKVVIHGHFSGEARLLEGSVFALNFTGGQTNGASDGRHFIPRDRFSQLNSSLSV